VTIGRYRDLHTADDITVARQIITKWINHTDAGAHGGSCG
jgi:hypothetical protein